jgi:hypothetical protein
MNILKLKQSPILFLDVDGVLNSWNGPRGINREMALRLLKIVNATKCSIVLSSAWRKYGINKNSKFGKALIQAIGERAYDILNATIDCTDTEILIYSRLETRAENILRYIKAQGNFPNNWVALDDLPIITLGKDHYVQTNGYVGLTDDDVCNVISFLNKVENGSPVGNILLRRRFTKEELIMIDDGEDIINFITKSTNGKTYKESKQSLYEDLFLNNTVSI